MEPQFLYLTTTGWKSGKAHEIEIWFVRYGARYYLVSEMGEKAHWVQNIQRQPAISFRVAGQLLKGSGRVVDPTVEPELTKAVAALMDAKYEWSAGLIVELKPETPHP